MLPSRRLTLAAAMLASAVSAAAHAADADALLPATDKSWKKLFDGKTLEGWKAADFHEPGKADVKDGALVMEKGNQMTGAATRGRLPED